MGVAHLGGVGHRHTVWRNIGAAARGIQCPSEKTRGADPITALLSKSTESVNYPATNSSHGKHPPSSATSPSRTSKASGVRRYPACRGAQGFSTASLGSCKPATPMMRYRAPGSSSSRTSTRFESAFGWPSPRPSDSRRRDAESGPEPALRATGPARGTAFPRRSNGRRSTSPAALRSHFRWVTTRARRSPEQGRIGADRVREISGFERLAC
jgi:hypothetical protein